MTFKVQGLAIPPWYVIAQDDIGVREYRGKRHHPRILEYHRSTTLPVHAVRDEVPWCSSAVNFWMEEAGFEGTRSAWAASWLNWGVDAENVFGAVTVLRRRATGPDAATGSVSGNHVALFGGMSDTHIRLLGGNQRNAVRYSNYPLRRYKVLRFCVPEGWK